MNESNERARWKRDETVLARIGAAFFAQETEIEIRLPKSLADEAVSAWQRNDESDVELAGESAEEGIVRRRAGTLGLIGCALEDRGRLEGNDVIVKLDAWFIGDALTAAEDANMIEG